MCVFPVGSIKAMLCFLVLEFHIVNKCLFFNLFGAMIFEFLLVIFFFWFKVASKCRAEVLSSVPKHKKAVMYLTEKIYVLGKLISGITVLSAVSPMLMNQQYTIY